MFEFNYGSKEHLENLVKVMQFSNLARAARFDGHNYRDDVLSEFLAKEYIEQLYQQSLKEKKIPGNTTHVTVIDNEFNIATVTTSFGEGSGYTVPGTNVMLNNMLGEEDLNPRGFHLWPENQRITSMMAPTIVLDKKRPLLALGSGGANRIRTAIMQVITNVVDFFFFLDEAVNNGRIHWENDLIDMEPGFDREIVQAIAALNNAKTIYFKGKNMYFGGVHSVMLDAAGGLIGAGDRRREGVVLSC